MIHATYMYLGTYVYLHALVPTCTCIRHECLPCRKNMDWDVAKMTYYMYFYQSVAEMMDASELEKGT